MKEQTSAEEFPVKIIARIHTDFSTKFGVPRQSGLVDALRGEIVFEPEYRNPDALRGIEGFSHLWLIWQFSRAVRSRWSPTVRPPRLGGNETMGVFATRSPYRPNPIGLSVVKLVSVENRPGTGPVLVVSGADLMDGTPILDIKPYLPYADCRPEATGGFTDQVARRTLEVDFPEPLLERIPPEKREAVIGVLAQDPRPAYQSDPDRRYGLTFADRDVRFTVEGDTLTVVEVVSGPEKE
ncbi:MAG: tRNA (N6-threonylcarbamoyladenosine(37)-N6)-methyltransferase TrmO [Clostridiales bacterium]|nr:tRNA (N6-threonylcarbamoyladenosine(37)-N6)-methyltransferase TrmO [Clostridiales bacterium]